MIFWKWHFLFHNSYGHLKVGFISNFRGILDLFIYYYFILLTFLCLNCFFMLHSKIFRFFWCCKTTMSSDGISTKFIRSLCKDRAFLWKFKANLTIHAWVKVYQKICKISFLYPFILPLFLFFLLNFLLLLYNIIIIRIRLSINIWLFRVRRRIIL